MMLYFICKNDSYQLCNAGKNQIRVQCFFILGATTCETEIFLDVINISFNNGPDFVSVIPNFGAANDTGICTKILFGINIHHSARGGRSTWIPAMADTTIFAIITFIPCGHGADEFLSGNAVL